jgi:Rha family phage regulatory protein
MDLVKSTNGELLTTSKIVAEVFGKTHKHVIEAIKKVECSDKFRETNFRPSSYTSQQNKTLKCYEMTEYGFYFLCMAFTGKKAAKWRESFLNTFAEMRKALETVDSKISELGKEAEQIKKAGSEWAKMGHEINRVKKGHLLEVQKVMDEVQMRLEF